MIIDQMSADTFTYESEMDNWDQSASVRVKPRRMLVDEEPIGSLYFSPEAAPEALHSQVQALGGWAIRETLIQRLYTHLETTTRLEQDLVNRVILKVAQRKIGISLPWDIAYDAYRIYSDESYHSLCSVDVERQIEVATGVKHHPMPICYSLARVEDLVLTVPSDLRLLAEIFATTISEMLVPSILNDILDDQRIVSTVREIVADHNEDEEKHFVYFAKLLEFLWPLLSEREQQEIGTLLPQFILAFLEPDYTAIERTLAGCNFEEAEAKQIIRESYPYSQVRAYVRMKARATLQQIEQIGIFTNQQALEAFQISDLID